MDVSNDVTMNFVLFIAILYSIKKKLIHCGEGDEAGLPEPIGDGDEIQFLIPIGYCNTPISIKAIKHANNTFIQEIEATPSYKNSKPINMYINFNNRSGI
ncbi:hypothetical protein MtrunA17_Chr7g0243591 [Medicago truncatula]|uniref:Uncharacterized protein n=1 Tax=Medicago truncatula TaxID=3880 RepID=A0A396GZM0_MEDTR|nr:hypothetical protein MtrunA17_Chr7g0243591 [Medicago truncatula]